MVAVGEPLVEVAGRRALRPLEAEGYVAVDIDPAHRRRLVTLTPLGLAAFLAEGKPLEEEFRAALLESGFPYERYLADTRRLAALLAPAPAAAPAAPVPVRRPAGKAGEAG